MKMRGVIVYAAALAYLLPALFPNRAFASDASGDSILGVWYTQDQEGGVEFYSCGPKVCGRFYWFKDDTGARDEHNPDPGKRQRPLCHMQFMGDFTKQAGGHYTDGWIYDPDSGSTYRAQMTIVDQNAVRLRGYILTPLLGASQIWKRAGSIPSCAEG